MYNTPKDAPDEFITAISDEPHIAPPHCNPPSVRAQINPTISITKLARALATEKLSLRYDPNSGDLRVTYATEFCPHGIEIKDTEIYPAVCENCAEDHGSTIQFGSVGK